MNPAWKALLSQKGTDVAGQLSALLAGKEVDLANLPPPKDPKEDPELRLRAFLERIDRALKAWGTDRFGHCRICATPIDPRVLDEQPWTMECPQHRN